MTHRGLRPQSDSNNRPEGYSRAISPVTETTTTCSLTRASRPGISILVKALNEEEKIRDCLDAAVREAKLLDGEVILVDSLSHDRTVEIALSYDGIRIVQFSEVRHCGCGSAVQLGYQFARGEFLYVLDADMVLEPGFLSDALALLRENPTLAGVGGKWIDTRVKTVADAKRLAAAKSQLVNIYVQELGGGGLYRSEAIESVGYLAHRELPAYEEAELGARLIAKGWKLMRIPQTAVWHTGHDETTLQMLRRSWKNRRAHAHGILLRDSLWKPWGSQIRRKMWFVLAVPALHLAGFIIGIALTSLSMGFLWEMALIVDFLLWIAISLGLIITKRSVSQALYSILSWHWFAVAAAIGALKPVRDPRIEIPARVIR
ncbi:MAG: glycosyltransferase [Nitrosospira sp.]